MLICVFVIGDNNIEDGYGRDGSAELTWRLWGVLEADDDEDGGVCGDTAAAEEEVIAASPFISIWFTKFKANSTPGANGMTLKKVPLTATMVMPESL